MELYEQLNLALSRCGYPPLPAADSYQPVGYGAWHNAYLVRLAGEEPLVIRLRKKVIYGRTEPWEPQALHEDYAPVGLYYRQANRCWPGVCPAVYQYRIDPDLVFTLESYVPGLPLPLPDLAAPAAFEVGRAVGRFFRAMHRQPAPLPGSGLVTWTGQGLAAASRQPWPQVWADRQAQSRQQLAALAEDSTLDFDRAGLAQTLDMVWAGRDRALDPVTLANRDISPENLLVRERAWVGLVDPVPLLDSGLYYAAWFLHCYRLFLPAVSDAPRYRRHHFRQHALILAAVAGGFEAGYAQEETALRQALRMDEFLWALDLAYESYQLLQTGLNSEMRLRRGDEVQVEAALQRSLEVLAKFGQKGEDE